MDFLKTFEWTPLNVLKALGVILAGLIVLSIAITLFGPILSPVAQVGKQMGMMAPSVSPAYYDDGYGASYDYAEEAVYSSAGRDVSLSVSNVASMPPLPGGGSVRGGAEDLEVTEYNASIESRQKEQTCGAVADLKAREEIVFINANSYERGCSYTFKVEHAHVAEVLAMIESLDPKDISESTYTIEKQIDDFTSEEEILKNKLASIDETLASSLAAYDQITALATRTENAEALAKIIDSKIGIIERLTRERLNTVAQLERLSRAKEEQLDRLVYTYFYVNVYEQKFIDGESLGESWKQALRQFVRDVNATLQNLTVHLISLLITAVQYIVYFLILLVIVKYLWKVTQRIWKA